jgi:hypothetical protein
MGLRLASLLPRVGVLAALLLGASATITFAAAGTLVSAPSAAPAANAVSSQPATLIVPDVRNQPFVFAKGMLEDAGFAWKIAGGAQGYATNLVAAQTPAAGTKVIDTGAPTIALTVVRNARYREHGAPEDASPYDGTALELAAPANAPAAAAPATTAKVAQERASTAKKTETPKPAASTKPAAAKYPQKRPAAFSVAGAPKEPLDEMPLPDRARLLGTWLSSHPQPTNANVRHWLYQHAWIVAGAKFGWWRGGEALKILIADDRHAASVWGIGSRSERIARAALAEVETRSK